MRTVGVAVVIGMQLVAMPLALACPPASSGVVSGANTEDKWYFSGDFSPGTYTIGVKATGSGNNSLTIRVQKRGSVGWSTVASSSIDMGDTDGCGTRDFQFTLTDAEEIRVQLSRTVASSQINYNWDVDFTVLWGGLSARCLVCS
jgi:autotransporter adhesin